MIKWEKALHSEGTEVSLAQGGIPFHLQKTDHKDWNIEDCINLLSQLDWIRTINQYNSYFLSPDEVQWKSYEWWWQMVSISSCRLKIEHSVFWVIYYLKQSLNRDTYEPEALYWQNFSKQCLLFLYKNSRITVCLFQWKE